MDYVRLLWDYRVLFLSGVILFGPSLRLPQLGVGPAALQVCEGTSLCTNGGSPWGVVTSVFLYDGWTNVPVYFAILLIYSSFSDNVESDERRRRAHFTSIAIFGAAFTANALWMLVRPLTYSLGPSGVVYSLWGVLLAFTLFDGMPKQPRSLNPRTWYGDKKERSSAVGNLAIFASTAIVLALEPEEFLSAGPGINVFAHAIGFLGGYFSAQAYRWSRKREIPTLSAIRQVATTFFRHLKG